MARRGDNRLNGNLARLRQAAARAGDLQPRNFRLPPELGYAHIGLVR